MIHNATHIVEKKEVKIQIFLKFSCFIHFFGYFQIFSIQNTYKTIGIFHALHINMSIHGLTGRANSLGPSGP